jgi:hypothetical protein
MNMEEKEKDNLKNGTKKKLTDDRDEEEEKKTYKNV